MMKPSTVRGRAAPLKTLVKRVEPMADFFQRLGCVFFASNWVTPSSAGRKQDKLLEIGSPEEMADQIQTQIVTGIQKGKIKLLQRCVVDALERKPSADAKSFARAPAVDEDDEIWQVSSIYWNNPNIDWINSLIYVDYSNVISPYEKIHFSDFYNDPKRPVAIHLSVIDPDLVIRHLVDYSKLPDEEWFSRYNRHAGIVTRECTAAAWRAIAVVPLKNEHGVQEQLVSQMNAYASYRNLTISEEALRRIARKIKMQWDGRSTASEVFVNTTLDNKTPQH